MENGETCNRFDNGGIIICIKIRITLGGAIVGWVLAYYGFAANQPQNPETLKGIVMLMSVYPAVIGVIGGVVMIFYPLTNKMMIKIEEDLTARRGNENPSKKQLPQF